MRPAALFTSPPSSLFKALIDLADQLLLTSSGCNDQRLLLAVLELLPALLISDSAGELSSAQCLAVTVIAHRRMFDSRWEVRDVRSRRVRG